MVAGAAAGSVALAEAAIVVRVSVFQESQSGHWPAHLTLCAPHSEQTYADFAFAIRNSLFLKVLLERVRFQTAVAATISTDRTIDLRRSMIAPLPVRLIT
jgi:hypothetical protein